MTIPTIKIQYNLNKEVDKFSYFLHHPEFPQHRNLILNAFSELKKILEREKWPEKKKEKEIIKKFIIRFQKKHDKKIKSIFKISERLLRIKSKKSLVVLSDLMDYKWPKSHLGYVIIPTILPFSPYEGNTFYFSILGMINNKRQNDVIFVSIHEISHMILLDILQKKYQKNINEIMKQDSWYFFKEIMAPVIMNQKQFKGIIDGNIYLGNNFLHHIFVIHNYKKFQITDFFQKIYEKLKSEKRNSFIKILEKMVNIILLIEKALGKKRAIWNKFGNNIVNMKSKLKLYSSPIKIKKAK